MEEKSSVNGGEVIHVLGCSKQVYEKLRCTAEILRRLQLVKTGNRKCVGQLKRNG